MKNLMITLLGLGLFLLVGCNRVDPKLVEEVQARTNKVQDTRPAIEKSAVDAKNLHAEMQKAPAGLKNNAESGYWELFTLMENVNIRYQRMFAEQDSINQKLQAVLDNYTDGKIEKKEAEEALSALDKRVETLQKVTEIMETRLEQCTQQFATMSANFETLPESEKDRLSKTIPVTIKPGAVSPNVSPAERPQPTYKTPAQQKDNSRE